MLATIAVNPITTSVAVLELKRSDGAILKLDSTHRLTAISPDGQHEEPYGLVSEADDFMDIAQRFMQPPPAPLKTLPPEVEPDMPSTEEEILLGADELAEEGYTPEF